MKTSTGKEATYEFPWEQPPAPKLGIDQCKTQDILYPDVMIVGSGPLGATYARKILTDKPAATVMMAEMGAQYVHPVRPRLMVHYAYSGYAYLGRV